MAPALSWSRWQSRPTGSPSAHLQGVRVIPHCLPAYLQPTAHPAIHLSTYLPAYLPTPALCCPHKKGVRERTMAPLLPLPLLTWTTVAPLLKEKCSLSLHLAPSCPTSLRAMGKPSFVDSFVPVWLITRRKVKVGGGGWRVVPSSCVWLQTPHCFSSTPPFLHSSLLLLLLSQGRQLNKEVEGRHLFFSRPLSN